MSPSRTLIQEQRNIHYQMKLRLNTKHTSHAQDSLQPLFLLLALCWVFCSFVLSAWVSCVHKESDNKSPNVKNNGTTHLVLERGAEEPAGK